MARFPVRAAFASAIAVMAVATSCVSWSAFATDPNGKEKAPVQPPTAQAKDTTAPDAAAQPVPVIRVGIIGLDTSHATAFTKILNDPKASPELANCRVVAAYPQGSKDIPSSVNRVPGYTKQVQAMGVEIVPTIDAMLEKVDAVLLESNDGRPHLEQVLPVLRAGKRVFVDKPIAGDLVDTIAIFEAAKRYKTPTFSSSSLRFSAGAQQVRGGKYGKVIGAYTWGPASLESTHPDLYWYGIHGVEWLYTAMGTGCETVTRITTKDTDVVVGKWKDGRVGSYRGMRSGKRGFGGVIFGEAANGDIGRFDGYRPLLVEIVKFFRTGKPPVDAKETIELYAFMSAADVSKQRGGVPVAIDAVIKQAAEKAKARLKALDPKP